MNTQNSGENNVKYIAVCCVPNAFWGILLVLLGGIGLIGAFIPLQHIGQYVLPAFLVLWGGYLLVNLRQARG